MRIIIIFFCLIFSFCSENQLENEIMKYEKEELKALNDVIINLWGRESGYVPKEPPPSPLSERKNKQDSLHYYEEEKYIELKFKELEAGIIDTTFFRSTRVILRDTLSKFLEYFDENVYDSELLVYVINTPRKFDIEYIQDRNGYSFVRRQSFPLQEQNKYISHTFSRILFSKDYSFGYFIMSSEYEGTSYFIENVNGKWEITDFNLLWIE